jgi:hypothetical protein
MGYSDHKRLRRALRRRSLLRKCGLVLSAGIRIAGIVVLAVAIYGALDYILALQPKTRVVLDVALGAGLFGVLVSWLLAVHRLGIRDMAIHLDDETRDPRRDMLSACELGHRLETRSSAKREALPDFLAESAVHASVAKLRNLGFRHTFPWRALRASLRAFGIQLLVALCIVCLDVGASRVISQRLVFPTRDIPPYSRYTFSITPSFPTVLYGGNLELAVTVHGAPVRGQVMCLTRHENTITQTACYKETGAHFVQRLERVTTPTEFCFSIGRARSRWQRIHVRYQPEVAAVRATVFPPDYTGLPAKNAIIGSQPLQAIAGSRVELRVTSNRDLERGELQIRPKANPERAVLVAGERAEAGSILFAWIVDHAATLSLRIFDVAGTPNTEPLVLEQALIPDLPPVPVLEMPPRHSLAMEGSKLPLRGHIDDDYGLRYVGLVRGLVGYRDRFKTEPGIGGQKRHEIVHEVDLGAVGAKPGDVLEFYIEAGDRNPALDGVAASELARVEIISEAEYTDMMRQKTTIDAFVARFREAHKALRDLRNATAALQDALASEERDDNTVEEQLKQLKQNHRRAQDVLLRLSLDFAIYDIEEQLQAQLQEVSRSVDKHSDWLHASTPDDPALPANLERMAADLNPGGDALEENLRDAEMIAAVARVMEQAQLFRRLLRQQTELVRRLERYRGEALGAGPSLLRTMQRRQEEIRTQLEGFSKTLRELAAALPFDMKELADDVLEFVDAIEAAEILKLMSDAESAAENQDGRGAWQSANVALERMKALLPDPNEGEGEGEGEGEMDGNGFAQLCAGQKPGSCSGDGIGQTLSQMLDALCNKPGDGSGRGYTGRSGGGAGGGDQGDGYWVERQSALDVPLFGPPRTDYAPPRGGEGHAGKQQRGSGRPRQIAPTAHERLETQPRTKADSRSMLIEELPPKYRDSIKRYFLPQNSNGASQP